MAPAASFGGPEWGSGRLNDKSFSEPIRLSMAPQRERTIRTAWEGIECLSDWPGTKGRSYRSALRACRDALDGWTPPAKARRALAQAAREAHMLVHPQKVD